MKIAVLYICTGSYDIFFKGFFNSAEMFLLPATEKHYFVFTDSLNIANTNNVHKINQKKLGWPKDTLMRFHLFLNIEEQLKEFDYLFFFNANYTFIKPINESEILPNMNDNYLVGQIHPVAYHKKRRDFVYEKNPKSKAYIAENFGKYYFAGGLIGGRTTEFLKMCHVLKNNIDIDFENNIIAQWHDESHINQYFSTNEPKKLHPGYCYPQDWYLPFEQKTLLLDKNKFGGHEFMRNQKNTIKPNRLKPYLFKIKLYFRAIKYILKKLSKI